MRWNYRVIRTEPYAECTRYGIHEVFYDNNKPDGWVGDTDIYVEYPHDPGVEIALRDLKEELKRRSKSLKAPVLRATKKDKLKEIEQ